MAFSDQFPKVKYKDLNSRQKESHNFQKLSGLLADYGFNSVLLSDDQQGADFLAIHIDGSTYLKVQIKARLAIHPKYSNKEIFIGFLHKGEGYIYPHDEFEQYCLNRNSDNNTFAWVNYDGYSWPNPPKWALNFIEKYKL